MKLRSAVTLGVMAVTLAGCSSHGDDKASSTPTGLQRTSPSHSATSDSSTSTSAPATSSSSSAASTSAPSDSNTTGSSDDATPDAAMSALDQQSNQYAPSSNPKATVKPRGGVGGPVNTQDPEAQIGNFLRVYYTMDTNNDTSDADAGYRARVYADSEYRSALSLGHLPSDDFLNAKAHHGYTTVAIKPSNKGQSEGDSSFRTRCRDVTVTWHGDANWKAPNPSVTSVCVTAVQEDGGWKVDRMDPVS